MAKQSRNTMLYSEFDKVLDKSDYEALKKNQDASYKEHMSAARFENGAKNIESFKLAWKYK